MYELLKLLADYEKANRRLFVYLQTSKINLPIFLDFEDIRDWCIEMRGYVTCLERIKASSCID